MAMHFWNPDQHVLFRDFASVVLSPAHCVCTTCLYEFALGGWKGICPDSQALHDVHSVVELYAANSHEWYLRSCKITYRYISQFSASTEWHENTADIWFFWNQAEHACKHHDDETPFLMTVMMGTSADVVSVQPRCEIRRTLIYRCQIFSETNFRDDMIAITINDSQGKQINW